MKILKKGQWYTFCCHLDLYQAKEDETFDEDDLQPDIYESEEEGLLDCLESWKRSNTKGNDCTNEIKECEERLKNLLLKK